MAVVEPSARNLGVTSIARHLLIIRETQSEEHVLGGFAGPRTPCDSQLLGAQTMVLIEKPPHLQRFEYLLDIC